MTHPFHPLLGRELEIVEERHCWGEHRVLFYAPEGDLTSIPASWTDVVGPDPFVALSAGRACFRVQDLLRLAHLLEGLERLEGAEDVR